MVEYLGMFHGPALLRAAAKQRCGFLGGFFFVAGAFHRTCGSLTPPVFHFSYQTLMETVDTGCAVSCRSAIRHSHVNRSDPATPFQFLLENLTVIAHKLIIMSLTVQLMTGNISPR